MPKPTKIIIGMLLILGLLYTFTGGYFLGISTTPQIGEKSSSSLDESVPALSDKTVKEKRDAIVEAWNIIYSDYVDKDKLNSGNLSRAAIEGIISSLDDPYTAYLSPEDYTYVQSTFQGEFEGIGAYVGVRDGALVILNLFSGAPAEKAGIRSGDVILEINGETVAGMSLDVAISKIRGPSGTAVELLILHRGEAQPVIIAVTRAKVEVPSVIFEMRGDVAYIAIYQFTSRTEEEFTQVMPKLTEEKAAGIILDLRGNPGGLLNIVVDIASHFITSGVIVSVRGNQGQVETYNAVTKKVTTDLPMVVLVDSLSASGSEVLAGALQDYDRALIAGNVTYGKGSANLLRRLNDGSGIYITIARWLTPKGRIIEDNGIQPDIELDATGEAAIQWAIDYLHGNQPQ